MVANWTRASDLQIFSKPFSGTAHTRPHALTQHTLLHTPVQSHLYRYSHKKSNGLNSLLLCKYASKNDVTTLTIVTKWPR